MTIKEAREIFGEEAANMTDEQVQQMMDGCDVIADMIIDLYLSLPPEERAKYRNKPSQDLPPHDPASSAYII